MRANEAMPDLVKLKPFDSCVTLGRFVSDTCIPTAADLLAVLDRYCIAEALVHEYHARGLHPLENGNRRLMDLIRNQPRLHPVWVLEPSDQPGRMIAEKMVDAMLAASVKVARLRLRAKGVLTWRWEDLLAALEAHRIPCFFDFGTPETTRGDLTDLEMDALRTIALRHPRLPMVISHVMGNVGIHPAAVFLVASVPNLYLDVTGALDYWRNVVFQVSPERVLFATGMPFTDPGILVSNVQYTPGLSETAKRLIYGDNLRRLMGGVG
jgi:predicted TIM-barrel fold metal-dependent hydrolase